jgi:hypothetical protein
MHCATSPSSSWHTNAMLARPSATARAARSRRPAALPAEVYRSRRPPKSRARSEHSSASVRFDVARARSDSCFHFAWESVESASATPHMISNAV